MTGNRADHIDKKGFLGRRAAFLLLGFALSAAALWYVFHNIEIASLKDSWHRIEIAPLVASIALYWLGMQLTRSFLVKHLLKSLGTISNGKALRYIFIGFLSNNILPARMGEIIRSVGISKVSGISFPSTLGAAAVERTLDLIMAAIIALLALAVVPLSASIRISIFAIGFGLLVVLAVLIFLSRRGLKTKSSEDKKSVKVLFWNLVVRFTDGFKSLGTSKGAAKAILLSALMWVFMVIVIVLRLKSFGLPASVPMALVLIAGLSLGVSLPSAPAYVGVYHAFAVSALALFGVDKTVALGFAVYCHLADVIPGCVLGAISMMLEGVSFADLKIKTNR